MSTPPDTIEIIPSSPASSQLPTAETSKVNGDKDAPDPTNPPESHVDEDKEGDQEVENATSDIFSNQFDSDTWNMGDEFIIADDTVRHILSDSRPGNFEDLVGTSGYTFPTDLGSDSFLSYGSILLDASNITPPSST
jgi:hypothetical protein